MEPLRNIILQHYNGTLDELAKKSIDNIHEYADHIDADYKLVTGRPFRTHLTDPCQKACVIDEMWDEYDNVLMLDPDMFITKKCDENVFDLPGCGTHGPTQVRLKQRLAQMGRIAPQAPYWAGSFYKFSRSTRQQLRSQLPANDKWMDIYNKPYFYEDEGILSELAWKARHLYNIRPQWYIGVEWNMCSFLPGVSDAKMIHIRTKKPGRLNGSWEDGGKQEKILNYQQLVDEGII